MASLRGKLRIRRNHVRDHAGNVRARTGTGPLYRMHVAASDAWYRAAGRRISGARQGISNWRNRRMLERGRRDMPRRAADSARSSLPVMRNRTDPATGRPNRDRAALGRTSDASLARMAPQRRADRAAAKDGPDAYRSGPAPREPGIYDLRDGRWTPARDVRAPDLTRRLPRERERTR